jgi:hypothetical protein
VLLPQEKFACSWAFEFPQKLWSQLTNFYEYSTGILAQQSQNLNWNLDII